MINMVIDRTYDGYITEINTIYGQLQQQLGIKIEPAPDEWDRIYNVDFFIRVGNMYIGLQIKPVNNGVQLPEIYKEYEIQAKTHVKFTSAYGGKVFYIFSEKNDGKKAIKNTEVINQIKEEINRLERL